MASSMPIPAPPRTPTPPSDDEPSLTGLGLHGVRASSPSRVSFDPNALSPLSDTFSSRYGSLSSTMATPASTFSSRSTTWPHSPRGENNNETPDDPEILGNPFGYQTQTYAAGLPSPVKSVRNYSTSVSVMWLTRRRTWDNGVVINTSIVVCRIKYSLNHPPERHYGSPPHYPCLQPKKAGEACQESRHLEYYGAFAICSWPHLSNGLPKARWH